MFALKSKSAKKGVNFRAAASLALLTVGFPVGQSYAFELLSEGAMGSVSAVSVATTEELLNVAGSPAAGLSDDYESLPFQTRISIDEGETDEVQVELDFALTQEVEAWADDLGRDGAFDIVDDLPETILNDNGAIGPERLDANLTPRQEAEVIKELEQQGRVDNTFEFLGSGVTGITVRIDRVIDSVQNISPEGLTNSAGSSFVTNVRSSGTNTLSAIRE